MSFTPERRRRVTAALALLALVALAAPARTEAPAAVGQLIAAARRDLAKGDGIGAEVRLRRAVAAGVGRPEVAAEMGQALLEQGDRDKAREWLGPAAFAPGDEVNGLRMLGFLERLEGNWAAAASAYDRALKLNPRRYGRSGAAARPSQSGRARARR
ncbi:MAG: hypothetical protein JF593_10840 [Novosphingobium sp.]|nr:hypothetical protein [Novosphingobium sp.]